MEITNKRYNLSNLQAKFTDYLIAENISSITLKNYRSDIKHFFNWIAKSNHDQEMTSITSLEVIIEYKTYLIDDQTPQKTLNRRLSAIRKFCSFCISQRWIEENHAKKVMNHKTTIDPVCHPEFISGSRLKTNEMLNQVQNDKITTQDDMLLEFKAEFPKDFDNLHDYFEIINYPQLQGK